MNVTVCHPRAHATGDPLAGHVFTARMVVKADPPVVTIHCTWCWKVQP